MIRTVRALVAVVAAAASFAGCADGREQTEAVPATANDAGTPVVLVTIGTDETEARYLGFPASLREAWPQVLFRTALPRRTVFVNLAEEG